jgi:hypothetical protein
MRPRNMKEFSLKHLPERDRYWVGVVLLLRRKICHLCEEHKYISKASVITIIDGELPHEIVEQEKIRLERTRKGRKYHAKRTIGDERGYSEIAHPDIRLVSRSVATQLKDR